jgi:proline dehydrogenase
MSYSRAVLFRLATSRQLERVAKSSRAGTRAAWRAASRYVAGRSRDEALDCAGGLLDQGHGVSVDCFGELVRDPIAAGRATEDYLELARSLPPAPADAWLSLDLTHLALDLDAAAVANRLEAIAQVLPPGRRIQIGAEDAARAPAILACVLEVARRGLSDRLGATVQANLLRSPADADALTHAGVHVRLVKGAYLEGGGAHPHGEPTDIAYLRLAFRLGGSGAKWSMATHDGRLREALLMALGPTPVEQLLGVRPDSLQDLHDRGVPTRVYVPYGTEWFRYWMRRLAESRGS